MIDPSTLHTRTVTPPVENGWMDAQDPPDKLYAILQRGRPAVSGRKVFIPDPPPPTEREILIQRLNAAAEFLCSEHIGGLLETHPELDDVLASLDEGLGRMLEIHKFLTTPERTGKKYGLTPDAFWEIVLSQGFGCAVCGVEFEAGGVKMVIDHNHDTGDVRGILCGRCNTGLGILQDSPRIVAAALKYLTEQGHYGESNQ